MPAPTIESHNHNTSNGGTTTTIAVSASGAGRVVVVCATIGTLSGSTVPTLTIAGGGANLGAWASVGKMPAPGADEYATQAWVAISSGVVSAVTVTITSSITVDGAAVAYVTVAGASTTQPLDQNSTLAIGGTSGGTAAKYNPGGAPISVTVSTNTANVLLFAQFGHVHTSITPGSPTAGATLTESANNAAGANWAIIGVFTQPFTSAQSGIIFGSTATGAGQPWTMFAFGITADSQGGGGGGAQARALVLA